MTELYLSRARLNARSDRLAQLLLPEDEKKGRIGAAHRLVWSLFPEELKDRPFLYRDMRVNGGRQRTDGNAFFILSSIKPRDVSGLFDVETKPFAPQLVAGDRLSFSLRANPAFSRNMNGKNTRSDVVMHALHHISKDENRASARVRLIREAGRSWLERQAAVKGFQLVSAGDPGCDSDDDQAKDGGDLAVDGYEQFTISRPGEKKPITLSRLEFEGELKVLDPPLFLKELAKGFGRARAFGCGLMLIRRV